MDKILIYDRVLIDMHSGSVIETEAHWHEGEVALCKSKGGGSTTVTQEVDKEYNARIAAVQERAQELSDLYFEFWEQNQAKLEEAQIQKELTNVDQQDRITKGLLNIQEDNIGATAELTKNFLNQSLDGVNKQEWANRAGVDQQVAADSANAQLTRNAARMGLNPNSGKFATAMANQATSNAANVAGARTQAFRNADTENYNRLKAGASAGLGLIGS